MSGSEQGEIEKTLTEARRLLTVGWCKFYLHTRVDGRDHYCAMGAVDAASERDFDRAERTLDLLRDLVPGGHVAEFNNKQDTSEPVLAAFDRAIAAAKERGL